jgi:flavin reductase (DIM6/NTAB) family NADH-FMN oxidoreductase RutF
VTVISLGQVDLAEMDPEERARLINCLPGYKPGMLVGTCGADKQSNLAIISTHFHLGSRPPLLAMILRPDTGSSERHTLSNILDTQFWTLNAFTLEQSARAHQTSAPYPRTQSEFAACDFTEEWKPNCQAPFVRESPLQVGCKLRQHLPLEINGTHMIIGEVAQLFFPSHAQREDGALALDQMDLVTVSGLDTYSQPEFGVAFRAARIDTPPREL